MLIPVYTKRFKRDINRCRKRKYNLDLFKFVAEVLISGEKLPKKHFPHKLKGEFSDCWECHILADWLLIYRYEGDKLFFEATGTHLDLF